MMYTFDLLDGNSQSYDLQVGVFADDQAACGAASALLSKRHKAAAVDIWDVERRVARVSARPAPPRPGLSQ